jgi:D-cysteine desulfhydrase
MPSLSRRAFLHLGLAGLCACDTATPPPPAPIASTPPSAPAPSAAPPVSPLARAFPRLAERVPRLPWVLLPTPIEPAPRLARRAGLDTLLVKRDDLSGLLYGGGKTRKLAFYLADAQRKGARSVCTFGGAGSNQAVATALYAAELGLRAILMLAPQLPGEHVRTNLLAALHAGAEIHFIPGGVAAAEERALREARRAPRDAPYIIPPGGSSPLGNLAFIEAALELADQIAAGKLPAPDILYMAMGTMGSAVGMAIGLRIAGLRTEVAAVRASSPETSSEARFFALARETVTFARGLDPAFPDIRLERGDVRVIANHLGAGYARPTAEGERAIALAREKESWALEPTYTGKTMAALLADAARLKEKVVLFWNSHNARPLALAGADSARLPAGLRAYFGKSG